MPFWHTVVKLLLLYFCPWKHSLQCMCIPYAELQFPAAEDAKAEPNIPCAQAPITPSYFLLFLFNLAAFLNYYMQGTESHKIFYETTRVVSSCIQISFPLTTAFHENIYLLALKYHAYPPKY